MKCFIKIMIVLHVRPGREHIGCRRLTHRSSQSPAARALWTLPMTRQCDWPLFRQGEANPLRSAFYTCQPTRSQLALLRHLRGAGLSRFLCFTAGALGFSDHYGLD